MRRTIYIAICVLLMSACVSKQTSGPELLSADSFTATVKGEQVQLYTLSNSNGLTVQLTNYGARIVSMWVPDNTGEMQDVVWGYNSIEEYLATTSIYSGPIVGRFGNRIGKGQFSLDGKDYQLTINDGDNHLHGGTKGYECCLWKGQELMVNQTPAVKMTYLSKDGEEGYPGNVTLSVVYALNDNNELTINYEATTDSATVINPTSHVYFNLSGTAKNTILNHVLLLNADAFTPTDAGLIPTGKISPVAGTPLDFTTPTAIGKRIDADYEPLTFGKGYDHNFVLNKSEDEMSLAAIIYSPESGIRMTVTTDQPAIQFYSGNFWDGSTTGRGGVVDTYRSGFALETQNFPDAPNHDNFPSSVLRQGEIYTHVAIYKFDVVE